jgi:hypothetical protein
MEQIIKNMKHGLMLSIQKKKVSTPAHRREFGQICTHHQIALTRHAKKSICPVSTSTHVGFFSSRYYLIIQEY